MQRGSLARLDFSYGLCYEFRKLSLKLLVRGLTNLTVLLLVGVEHTLMAVK